MSTKYDGIVRYITEQIEADRLKPGQRLPSIRGTASRFACSRNTVIRAYEELVQEHLIFSVAKSGYYVVEKPRPTAARTWNTRNEADSIDFASAAPDERAMPYEDFRHCLNQAIDHYRDKLFSYGDPQGLLSLRETLVKHFYGHQIFVKPEQICIVSGAQQALHILTGMRFPNGKSRILLEQPAYNGIHRSIAAWNQTALGITRTADGLDMEQLERHFRYNDIKFFYTVPRFNNPFGASYTQEEQKKIVKLAEAHDVYIVEDDYLADLDADSSRDPMFSMDRSGHVIYIKSFSKTVLPGMRLGAAVLPRSLVTAFRLHKASDDSATSPLLQGALEIYLKTGMFERHTADMRALYGSRMAVLGDACSRLLPEEVRFKIPENGIFAVLALPETLDAAHLTQRLNKKGAAVVDVNCMFLPGAEKERLLRIGIIRADERAIEKGIALLAAEIRHALKHGQPRHYAESEHLY